uniref:Uncharacterized protein n=1 Tax=Magnetococcus massalia (strain MO-1) TaxID=451514 RepID=A0A1S7LF30_MAGMO|nr:Membrane protein of unknown function [Candidatus Magnetococcus massalia]
MTFNYALPLISLIAAAMLGLFFAFVWRRLMGTMSFRYISQQFIHHAKPLLSLNHDDDDQFFHHYKSLIKLIFRYMGRNLLAMALGLAPFLLAMLLLFPMVRDQLNQELHQVVLYPPLEPAPISRVARCEEEPAKLLLPYGLGCADPYTNTAICWQESSCMWLSLLDFDLRQVAPPQGVQPDEQRAGYLLVRPTAGDGNPLWPFLSDFEAALYALFSLMAMLGFLWPKRRQR